MLLYYCAPPDTLPLIAREGLRGEKNPICLHASLKEAQEHCSRGRILVIDALQLDEPLQKRGSRYCVSHIPPSAIYNAVPYRPPRLVPAAGGILVRQQNKEPEVLLIFRKGKWDLPKGKLKPGETSEAAALREVQEELGISEVRLVRPLDVTWHAYPLDTHLAIKPTHWYLMHTPEDTFIPRREEGITDVQWFPLYEAAHRLGYPSLRTLLLRHAAQLTRT